MKVVLQREKMTSPFERRYLFFFIGEGIFKKVEGDNI